MADIAQSQGTATERYQSLYRRYRPQRFDEVRGQEPVTRALRNAVREGKVGHAYLFSGPRGTGKTSTARILAMVLNCEHPDDGEPCGTCESCLAIRQGASLDVHELDAASNRRLDEMRDLLARVSLATPGRWKVYIVDEVHQLTPDAASALLKTLEEPPGHVVFVLATTDPQKVLPTIRSRTQHFEFRLLAADVLGSLLRDVNTRAGLGVPPEAIDVVVRRGHGSARDALSVLDQVAAAGGVEDDRAVVSGIVDALAERDPARVLAAVAEAVTSGRDPRRLASDLLDQLRNGFLALQDHRLVLLPDDAAAEVEEQARLLGQPSVVRALEVVGQAAIDMREAVDPRVTLEVALVRVAAPRLDGGTAALAERVEQLERQVAALTARAGSDDADGLPAAPAVVRIPSVPPIPPAGPGVPPPTRASSPAGPVPPVAPPDQAMPRRALGAHRRAPAPPGAGPGHGGPSRDELTKAWGDHVLPGLPAAIKPYVSGGRFVSADGRGAVYALPDQGLVARAEPLRPEIEAALTAHFGQRVAVRLVVDGQAIPVDGPAEEDDEEDPSAWDLDELEDAGPGLVSPEQRLLQAFPGAEEVTP